MGIEKKKAKTTWSNTLSVTNRRSFIKKVFMGAGGFLAGTGFTGSLTPASVMGQNVSTKDLVKKKKLRPVLDSDYWLIGPAPHDDLKPEDGDSQIEPVDHHILKANDGNWHLWGCVRNTKVGRVLYHWKGESLEDSNWEQTGEMFRCNFDYGECIDDWYGQEWMQSPYFVQDSYGKYYMFYGGHSTGRDVYGNSVPGDLDIRRRAQCQICLMTSNDGVNWTRYKNKDGYSRILVGPGQTRDPCLINIDGIWHMYYAGDEHENIGGIYLRTSKDLYHWSKYRLVHYDATFGETTWDHECPHVIYREGYFYLLKTESYTDAITHVYRSRNPKDFGVGTDEAQPLYVGEIACGAPEIYQVDGKEYVSSSHNPPLGTQMARLTWEPV